MRRDGPNQLPHERPPSLWTLFLHQFKNVLTWVLVGAILLSLALGHAVEAAAITIIVAFSVVLGLAQEVRAQRAIGSLRRLAPSKATVVRDGTTKSIDATEVVVGDVLLLTAGDRVAADARLAAAVELSVAEASLTGESVPVDKDADALLEPKTTIGDRKTMVFATTLVTRGRARAVVTGTGAHTEVGAIGRLLAKVRPEPTPLERQLARIARWLIWIAAAVVLLVLLLGLARGHDWREMLLFAVALAVAVVPEALPAVVTISLALGAQRMARRNAVVRRLPVVETLGSTTTICSDKTGTLTLGEMTVVALWTAGTRVGVTGAGYAPVGRLEPPLSGEAMSAAQGLAQACVLCNDSELLSSGAGWTIRGDPTEAALLALAGKTGLDSARTRETLPRVAEVGFTSERKRMTTVHRTPGGTTAFSKGAPEVLLLSCDRIWSATGVRPLAAPDREDVTRVSERLAEEGMRVLAFSMRGAPTGDVESGHIFLGLVGIRDPPRPEVAQAVATCHAAGIRPLLITGDHPATARAIAREVGFRRPENVLTGRELDDLPPERLAQVVLEVDIYARVSPHHKLAIVDALKAHQEIVAMTGDGVNDAPALRRADIGVAMGITGTDVAKDASAMILADDNFATIVAAVEEGRTIFDNVRKYLVYLMSTNFGEIALIAGTMLLGLPLPLSAVQILYVNLASDGLPALALAVDPHEEDVMKRRPRRPGRSMLDRPLLTLMLGGGLYSALVNIVVFWWALGSGRGLEEAMAMTFVSLVLIQFTKAYVFRSQRRPVWHRPFANRWLNLAIVWEVFLILLLLYVPPLRTLFGLYALTAVDWLVVLLAAGSVLPVLECAKWALRRGWFRGRAADG